MPSEVKPPVAVEFLPNRRPNPPAGKSTPSLQLKNSFKITQLANNIIIIIKNLLILIALLAVELAADVLWVDLHFSPEKREYVSPAAVNDGGFHGFR